MKNHRILQIACIALAVAVILGAFGAHALREVLTDSQLHTWETATRYHFYHGLGMLLICILHRNSGSRLARWSCVLMLAGILLFSGSLYLLSSQNALGVSMRWLGPVTPIGGVCFIAGWALAAMSIKDIRNA